MSPDEFRRQGHAVVDWLAKYFETVEEYPVQSRSAPGDIRKQLPAHPPRHGESFEHMLADIEQIVVPGLTHWQSPNFFAYFPSNNSGPSILGELLSAGLGVQGMLWATSPACTEIETHVLDWLVELMDLPRSFLSSSDGGGVIQDTASSAIFAALVAARDRCVKTHDLKIADAAARLRAYASEHTHSSLQKALHLAGLDMAELRCIPCDENFAMRSEALEQQIQSDLAAGLVPMFVCATIGSTSSHAIDPLAKIADICQRHAVWLHADGAMSGTAALCPEFRPMFAGLDGADSYVFNPHKWMFTNFDCSCLYVKNRADLIAAMSITPEYLRTRASDAGEVFDYRDWHIQLGRRFRALKLWFVLRHYGHEGLMHHVREHVRLGQAFADWVRADEDFELMAPVPLNLVCFRHRAGDTFNERLLHALNRSGKLYMSHTRLDGQYTLRMSIGTRATTQLHVEQAWARIQATARELQTSA